MVIFLGPRNWILISKITSDHLIAAPDCPDTGSRLRLPGIEQERAATIALAIVGRAKTLERETSKKKQRTSTKKAAKRGLRVITLQGAIKKSPILLSQKRLQKED